MENYSTELVQAKRSMNGEIWKALELGNIITKSMQYE